MAQTLDMTPTLTGTASLPTVAASPPFLLAWARGWSVLDGRLVPSLRRWTLAAGINGVEDAYIRRDSAGSTSYARAIQQIRGRIERADQVYLPWDDGPGGARYIIRHKVRDGNAHLPPWERPVGARSERVKVDVVELARWVAHWVAEGLIDATPTEDAKLRAIADLEARIDRQRSRAGGGSAPLIARLEAELALWTAAETSPAAVVEADPGSEFDEAPAEPAPPTRRGRKKAAETIAFGE